MNRFSAVSVLFFLLGPIPFAGAQQSPAVSSYGTISYVDFAYGFPTYYGDLWRPGGGAVTYRGAALAGQQYNTTAIYAGALIPVTKGLYIRPQFANTTFFFQEPVRRVFFRNTVFDAGVSAQYFVVRRRFGLYAFAGPSVAVSYRAELKNSQQASEREPMGSRTARLGLNAGAGLQFALWRQINLFTEYQWSLTGSDRVDGYNGDIQSGNGIVGAPEEKPYFQRDQIGVIRAGIRLPITRPPSRIEERPRDMPLSTLNPDPSFDEVTLRELENRKAKEKRDKPELYYKLNVQKQLKLYTVAVSHTLSLEELDRFQQSAGRIAAQVNGRSGKIQVQLLEERTGYTVHFGPFSSQQQARQFSRRLSAYYRDTMVRYHGR